MSDYLAPLEALFAGSSAVYFVFHPATQQALYLNRAFHNLTSLPLELLPRELPRWRRRVQRDDWRYLRQRLDQAELGQPVEGVELRVTWPSGSLRWLCVHACRVLGADGAEVISGRIEDITQAKEASRFSQVLSAQKNATLQVLSHDLAEPLLQAQQLAQQLASEPDAAPVVQLVQLLERVCADGVELVRHFIAHEVQEANYVPLKRERTDLRQWLQVVVSAYQHAERGPTPTLTLTLPARPVYVSLDVMQFPLVLTHLLSNARKFTPDQGQVEVVLTRRRGRVTVQVQDTGIGIPTAWLPVVFDKCTPARRPGLRGERGAGLGLASVRALVQRHDGEVALQSTEGTGTCVTVTLPVLPA